MGFSPLDYAIFIFYGISIISLGLWVSRDKEGHEKDEQDYFLASKSLTWWAVGASLIASNISAEQFIGMSGSGYAVGLAIASYEWMAALTLIVVAKFVMPTFIEKEIYTMPQFLNMRYDSRVQLSLAIFWILLYVFVNLTSVMYLGSLALRTIFGIDLMWGIIGLALFAAAYSLYGGLSAVAWTDVVQVVILIGGGLITSYLALDAVGGNQGVFVGFATLLEQAPEKFHMIINPGTMIPTFDGAGGMKDAYLDLPGIGVLIGGMWVANLAYWGFNQYIIQRGLAAKNIAEAQKGMVFAAVLKMILPLIVVIPGVAAFVLGADLAKPDEAYPWLLAKYVPNGLLGLTFAALAAAIVSSLASMLNSTSTIFTVDIYKRHINPNANSKQMVFIGRMTAGVALVVATFAARPLLGGMDQGFQFIQEFSGMVTPGVLAIFVFGLFWKKASANAAVLVAAVTIPLGFGIKFLLPSIPFLDRMGYVFIILSLIMIVVSYLENKAKDDEKGIHITPDLFKTNAQFNFGALGVSIALLVLYTAFW